jgi:hypothetical protein
MSVVDIATALGAVRNIESAVMRYVGQGIALKLTIALGAVALGTTALGLAAVAPSSARAQTAETRAITYAPRDGTSKKMRVMGESRSLSGGPTVAVLAPDEAGRTTLAQPTLYWFVSEPIYSKIELLITDEDAGKTVFSTIIDGPAQAGIAPIQLGELRVSLRTNRDYRWSVAVVRDSDPGSANLFASGVVRRADMAPDLAAQLNRTAAREMPFFLAKNGLWYDALAVLSVQIARQPDDRALRGLRASLLDQVGLYDVAKFDRE